MLLGVAEQFRPCCVESEVAYVSRNPIRPDVFRELDPAHAFDEPTALAHLARACLRIGHVLASRDGRPEGLVGPAAPTLLSAKKEIPCLGMNFGRYLRLQGP